MTDQPRTDLLQLRDRLRAFASARNWDQFHTPRNLATALSVEASELLEHFQWGDLSEADLQDAAKRERIAEEVADVLLYLVRLADKLDLDVSACANAKIDKNEVKYPVEKAWGSSRKYTEL